MEMVEIWEEGKPPKMEKSMCKESGAMGHKQGGKCEREEVKRTT